MKSHFLKFTAKTQRRESQKINTGNFASLRLCGEKWLLEDA